MKKHLCSYAAVLGLMLGGAAFAVEVESGLATGQSVPPFTVHDVTGPQKGEDLCYRCRYGSQPVVAVFTKSADGQVGKLAKKLDDTIAGHREDSKMAGFLVLNSDSPATAEPTLNKLAESNSIKQMPLTFAPTKNTQKYKLNPDAEVTVMMWVDGKVKVNRGFAAKDLTDETIASIVSDTSKILN